MKYPFYIKEADPAGVKELYDFLRPFYDRYPTGNEVGECLHQIRRELDLIVEVEKKKQRIKELEDELNDAHDGTLDVVSPTGTDVKRPAKRTGRTSRT